ncbi:MAG TPA: selenocysteine-specific translation elongation factor [Candidatus Omnitrophota bacterium]|nr:selenocysteine-specific translation elongation factor [Candidatus Omnitrophota bacterium]
MRPVIVGTAGHIDHGKTALVRRLTGIDTDRLKEEKERGISIDLGFAHLVLPSGARVGIVDVPGHERFVKNMLAGATGIDVALLVVAADEGVKPQTQEHLAIVDLLGIRRGVVALTKSDLAPPERIARARDEVGTLLRGTGLEGAPILPVSAVTGDGVAALLEALDRAAADAGAREAGRPARLPIDRVFSIEGIGTVVTGTLWSGTIRAGDSLQILPSARSVRVRRVEVHDAEVPAATAGQRTAVALHGAGREEIERGEWLVAQGGYRAAEALDVRLTMLPGDPRERALATRTRLRIHLGASEVLGRAVLLEGETLEPGASAYAQLRLEHPVVAAPGDRLVLRSYSPAVTIAGAMVIDPAPPRRSRLGGGDLERLKTLETGTLPEKVLWLARESGMAGMREDEAALRLGVAPEEIGAAALDGKALVRLKGGRTLFPDAWGRARGLIQTRVREYAEAHPLRAGVPKGELKSLLTRDLDGGVFDEALASLLASREVELRGDRLLPPGAGPSLSEADRQLLERIEQRLAGQGFQPPELSEVLRGVPRESRPTELVRHMIESGRAVKVTSELVYTRAQWEEIERRVAAHFARSPRLGMGDFKGYLQISRKYAVPLLEHLDRLGITRREGDERIPGPKLKK